MITRLKIRLLIFRRKFWRSLLGVVKNHVTHYDMAEVLDETWWALVQFRLSQLGQTPEGISVAGVIFLNNEGEAIGVWDRDVRDTERDIRGDRVVT